MKHTTPNQNHRCQGLWSTTVCSQKNEVLMWNTKLVHAQLHSEKKHLRNKTLLRTICSLKHLPTQLLAPASSMMIDQRLQRMRFFANSCRRYASLSQQKTLLTINNVHQMSTCDQNESWDHYFFLIQGARQKSSSFKRAVRRKSTCRNCL